MVRLHFWTQAGLSVLTHSFPGSMDVGIGHKALPRFGTDLAGTEGSELSGRSGDLESSVVRGATLRILALCDGQSCDHVWIYGRGGIKDNISRVGGYTRGGSGALKITPAKRWESLNKVVSAIGAAPLAQNDPVRSQLVALAKSGAEDRHLTEFNGSPITFTGAVFRAIELATGERVWESKLDSDINQVQAADGWVYVITGGEWVVGKEPKTGYLYKLNSATGKP